MNDARSPDEPGGAAGQATCFLPGGLRFPLPERRRSALFHGESVPRKDGFRLKTVLKNKERFPKDESRRRRAPHERKNVSDDGKRPRLF